MAQGSGSGGSGYYVTFAARVCPEYTDIFANRARNDIVESLKDLGPDTQYDDSGVLINPAYEDFIPPQTNCESLPGWQFTLGTGYESRAVTGDWGSLSKVTGAYDTSIVTQDSTPLLDDDASPVPDTTVPGATTIELTDAQRAQANNPDQLWAQGGTPTDPVRLGGLGHLGVQYAAKMGFKTVGIARGKDKEPLARKLGAWHYIDSQTQDPTAELTKLGGAKVILATVTDGKAMTATIGGLAANGTLLVCGAPPSLEVSAFALISGKRSVKGWYSGTSIDSQDTLAFSAFSGVRSMNEVFPIERAAEAYERMMSGKARFRVVLTTGQ